MELYMQNTDFFRRKGLCKIKAQLWLLHYYELMKLHLKNCTPPPQKKEKKFLRGKKTNQNDLIMITPATPKKQTQFRGAKFFPSSNEVSCVCN